MARRALVLVVVAAVAAGCGGGSKSSSSATRTSTVTVTAPGARTSPTQPHTTTSRASAGQRIAVGDIYFFKTPSGRIGCAVSRGPTTLRCDTAFPTRFSHSGHRCADGDYGQAFELLPHGAAKAICAGDTVLSATNEHTIPYGGTWLLGPYTCISRTSGLSCRNGDGHGLALSLQEQKVY